ncbi:MAG TPA: hypothetical protein VEJ36_04790 [Nitrososphaerales archaeon]|nr:hypothetical protein [Nitrososphaerales archaeon]
MKLGEAWKLSKTSYVEVAYRSNVMTRGTARGAFAGGDPAKRVRSIVRGTLISKISFTVLVSLASAYVLLQYERSRTPAGLAGAVTFSLAIAVAYIVLYSLQVLPSFSGGESFELLTTLPLSKRDLSLVTFFSFARTFDFMLVASIATQVVVVALLTGSALATVLMFLAAAVNSAFAVWIALTFSTLFYRNITKGGRGKGAALARLAFLISWGFAALSIAFSFNFIATALPAIDGALTGTLSRPLAAEALALLHPISEGIAVSGAAYPGYATSTSSLAIVYGVSYAAFVAYLLLAVVVARRTLSTILAVAQGKLSGVARTLTTEFKLRIRSPVPAYLVKDARIASKSPQMAFVFALPVFETVFIGLYLSGFGVLGSGTIVYATGTGCAFTLFGATALLNTEGTGLEFTMALPVVSKTIVDAKSLISTLSYTPVPVAISAALLLGKHGTSLLLAVPFLEIAAVSAASSAELAFFVGNYKSGGILQTSSAVQTRGLSLLSAGDILRLVESLAVAALLVGGPLVTYAIVAELLKNYAMAVVLMGGVSVSEWVGVQLFLRKR